MYTVRLTDENYFGVFLEAEKVLRSNGAVVGPTDTVYGIFCRADNAKSVKKIFKIKKRSVKKAMPVFVKDIAEARKYAYISDSKARFLEKIWPGKVTVIFHHKEKLPKILTAGKNTLAMRMPDNKFLLELLSKLNFPLAQTSANISGGPPAKNMEEIKTYFPDGEEAPDLIIDGGEIAGDSSVVIDFTGPKPIVLRAGIMAKNDFDRMLESMV